MTPPDYTPFAWIDDDGSGTTGTLYDATKMNNIENQLDLISDLFVAFKATVATDAILPGAPTFAGGVFTASANVALTVDSASAASGDVVLVKNEIRTERNGIYIVNNAGGAGAKFVLSRVPAQSSEGEVIAAEIVSIEKGLANGDSIWRLASEGKLNPDKTPQEFTRVAPESDGIINVRLATAAALPANGRVNNTLTANANAALKVDSVSVAVGDLILVKNEGTGKHNGVYSVTAAGAAGAKWVLDRAVGLKTTQDATSGSIVTVSEGTRNSDRQFTLTTDAPITLNTTALTFALLTRKDFGLVTELPTAEAVEGDLCTYMTEFQGSVMWQLVYDGIGELPWKFIGGPPLLEEAETERTQTNQTTYAALTGPLKITCPLKGDYDIRTEILIATVAGSSVGYGSYKIGATAASDAWAAKAYTNSLEITADLAKTTRQKSVAAAAVVEEQCRTGGNYKVAFKFRRLIVTPVRVG